MLLRNHGRDENDDVVLWGFNSRLDNLHAAFLNARLSDYDSVIERRREIAACYHERLHTLEEVSLPPSPNANSENFDVYQNYEIAAERRDELRIYLNTRNVGTHIQWGGKLVHQFKRLGFKQILPFSEDLMSRMLMLPINMSLTNQEVDYVSNCVLEFYRD